jgi:ribosomal protein S18 acetylase RimI-like enzyme
MNVVVRPAQYGDVRALVALNDVVQSLHARLESRHFKTVVDRDELHAFFTALLNTSGSYLLIAETNSSPDEYLWFDLQDRPPTPFTLAQRRIYIQHIVVREEARRSGVASALLQTLETEARVRGVERLAVDMWAANDDAQHFFRAAGFTPFNIALRKDLR